MKTPLLLLIGLAWNALGADPVQQKSETTTQAQNDTITNDISWSGIATNAKGGTVATIAVQTAEAPDLAEWGRHAGELCAEWYPKILTLLETEPSTPPKTIQLVFHKDMPGVANTERRRVINISAGFVRKNTNDWGMVVHELVHTVQAYGGGSWLTEGIADYIRLAHFEPNVPPPPIDRNKAKYTDSYKTTATFLRWIEKTYDKQFVTKVNMALAGKKYDLALFKDYTGKPIDDLWQEFAGTLPASVEGITEYQFDNGLRLLLYPDNSRSKVTVNMTVLVGSRHEGYGETGMAHLLEHLVFKGTPNHRNIPKALQDHGAQFNGSTSPDRTNYYETTPADDDNLEFSLRLEADRLVNSYIKKEDLDSEMTVVRNEFERGENSPPGVLMKRISAAAYEWHNYGKSTIGNRSDIERVPIENLRAFYKKFYQPDNVVLVVAGKFDPGKTLEFVRKYFGTIPRPERKLDATYTEEPDQDGERLVSLRRVGDIGVVGVAYHIPAGPHQDSAALQVLANILTTQPSGRFYKTLIETKKVTSAFAGARGEHDPGLLTAQAEVRDSKTLAAIRDLIIATIEEIGAKGVTTQEVNRARQQILKARELAATDTSQIAISLSEWAAQGDWRLYFLHRDRIEKVTPADVQAAASKYLQRNNRTVGLFIPTDKPQRIAIPATPDVMGLVQNYKGRAAMVAGEAFDVGPSNIEARVQREALPEGIKVSLLPKKTRGQEVHLALTLRYGNDENLKGFEAAAGLLPQLMLRGTKKFSFQDLRDELDRLNATLGTGGGGGGRGGRGRGAPSAGSSAGAATFSIQTKRDNLPEVLDLLRQVLREPTLPADEFEVLKRERLASMEQARTDPGFLAGRFLSRELAPYKKDDIRYVPAIEESIARLSSVTHKQVVQLYRKYLGSQAGELSIVGDFDPQACLPKLKEALSGWTAAKPYARITTPVPDGLAASQHKLNTPDKANATYTAGLLFPMRDDDLDYPAVVIANYIFGGGALSSRLGTRIRQQEGLSYSVGSSLTVSSHDKRAGLTITAICNPRNIARVEKAAREELERLLRDGVTPEELDQARQGYLQAQKVRRTTDDALAGLLSELSYAGRTMAYYIEQQKRIEALTPEQILGATRKYFDPKKLVLVTAGDFETKLSTVAQ